MENFWEWMTEKGYAVITIDYIETCITENEIPDFDKYSLIDNSENYYSPDEKNLIGFFIEFIISKKLDSKECSFRFDNVNTISDLYESFKRMIRNEPITTN